MKSISENSTLHFKKENLYRFSLVSGSMAAIKRAIANLDTLAVFQVTSQPNGEFERPDCYIVQAVDNPDQTPTIGTGNGIESIRYTLFKVQGDVSFELDRKKCYEFFTAWTVPENAHLLQEFFEVSEPIRQSYGRPAPVIRAQFGPVEAVREDGRYFSPSMGGMVEWDDRDDVFQLMGYPKFTESAAPLFAQAVSRIEMVIGQLM